MEINDIIREYWEQSDKKYSLPYVKDVILGTFKAIRDFIGSEELPDIRIPYFGLFERRNWKVLEYAKNNIVKYDSGRINSTIFEENIKSLYKTLKREEEYYSKVYYNLYPMVIKYLEEYFKAKENGKDIPNKGWFYKANREYFVNRAIQNNMEKRQDKREGESS